MPQTINTNLSSLTAQRNLNTSQASNQQALQRLSSGLRINSARDDAAGLAISTRFTAQVKGLNVAIRNAGDGISLAQTAEGALGAITDSLQRIRELSLQAANATNSDSDRQALNAEAQQQISEISRVSNQTNFNGRKLLDGTFQASVQIGTHAGETVAFGIGQVTADKLGGGTASGVSAIGTTNGIANGDLIVNGVAIGPSKSADDTASTTNRAASAIAKAAAINRSSAQTGVTAQVNENRVAGTSQVAAALTGSVVVNGVTIAIATGGVDTAADRQATLTAINARAEQTGVRAVDTGNDSSGVELIAKDGRNITLSFNTVTAAATGLGAAGTTAGGYTLLSTNGGSVTIVAGGDGTGNGNLSNAGLVAGTYDASAASVSTTSRVSVAGAGIAGTNTFTVAAPVDIYASATAAKSTAGAAGAGLSGFDFSGSNANFNLAVNGTTQTISLTTDLSANQAALLAGINSAISTAFGSAVATASVVSGRLVITSATTGPSSSTRVTSVGGSTTAQLGFSNESAANVGAAKNDTLSVTVDGGSAQSVTLTAGLGRTAAQIATDLSGLTGATAAQVAGAFTITSSVLGATSAVAVSGLFFSVNTITATATAGAGSDITTLSSGDLLVNGVAISAAKSTDDTASDRAAVSSSSAGSGIATAAAVNRSSGQTGVVARANGTVVTGGTSTTAATAGNSGTVYINNVATTKVTATGDLATDRGAAINAINAVKGRTGVVASDNGASITLTAADGRNISVAIDTANSGFGAGIGLDNSVNGIGTADITGAVSTYAATAETTYSTVTLTSAKAIKVASGNNGATGVSDIGFRQGQFGGATDGQFLTDVDISTLDGASGALKAVDNALDSVNRERANLGAIQNRLDSTVSTLAINSENTSAANSRIRDADFAKETAELQRTNVLQQAGISILAQANAQPQLVLSLLR